MCGVEGEVGGVEKMKEGWWRGRGTGERWGRESEREEGVEVREGNREVQL